MHRLMINRYVLKRFLFWVAAVTVGLGLLFVTVDLIEALRRNAGQAGSSALTGGTILSLIVLKAPFLMQKLFPFTILFAALATFGTLAQTQELTALRAAGLSIWRLLTPVLIGVLALGTLQITFYNPWAARLFERFEVLDARSSGSTLDAAVAFPLWLRQPLGADEGGGALILQIRDGDPQQALLKNLTLFRFDAQGRFHTRFEASSATLDGGSWTLRNGFRVGLDGDITSFTAQQLRVGLTMEQIRARATPSATLQFWRLPALARVLQDAGIDPSRTLLSFHDALATPFLLCGMILLAAAFTARLGQRGYSAGLLILTGLFSSFALYLFGAMTQALSLSTATPVFLAAWSPAALTLLCGAAALLHLEDG